MNNPETKTYKSIINRVDDGFNFFNSGFLDELTTDKKYYVEAFMEYIEELEKKCSAYNKPYTLMTYNHIDGESIHEVCTNDPEKYLERVNRDRIADGEVPDEMSEYTKTQIHLETFKIK